LPGSPPGLRLVEVDTNFQNDHGSTRCEYTPRRQDPSCRRTERGWISVRSGYDHRKLRLLGSPPGLHLAELNAGSVAGHDCIRSGHEYSDSAQSEYKQHRQSPSCRQTYTPIPNRKTLPKADVGQSTSTRSAHKPPALPKVCTKHCRREYACRNHDLAVLLTN
jgi:hypothetical protein